MQFCTRWLFICCVCLHRRSLSYWWRVVNIRRRVSWFQFHSIHFTLLSSPSSMPILWVLKLFTVNVLLHVNKNHPTSLQLFHVTDFVAVVMWRNDERCGNGYWVSFTGQSKWVGCLKCNLLIWLPSGKVLKSLKTLPNQLRKEQENSKSLCNTCHTNLTRKLRMGECRGTCQLGTFVSRWTLQLSLL